MKDRSCKWFILCTFISPAACCLVSNRPFGWWHHLLLRPESFTVFLSWANYGLCHLNLAEITKFKYEKENEKYCGPSSEMTPSCKWCIHRNDKCYPPWKLRRWKSWYFSVQEIKQRQEEELHLQCYGGMRSRVDTFLILRYLISHCFDCQGCLAVEMNEKRGYPSKYTLFHCMQQAYDQPGRSKSRKLFKWERPSS